MSNKMSEQLDQEEAGEVKGEQSSEIPSADDSTSGGEPTASENYDTQQDETSEQVQEVDERQGFLDKIKEMEEEISDLKDQYLRKQADFENFRKRMFREKEEAIKYGNSNLLVDLIQIIDDFERAIKSSEESRDFESFHSGIEMIEKQFISMLEKKYGMTRMNSLHTEFDPEKHEALMMESCDDFDTQTVLEVFQNGYMLHDRVLRHAKVKVSSFPTESSEKPAESDGTSEGNKDTKTETGDKENG